MKHIVLFENFDYEDRNFANKELSNKKAANDEWIANHPLPPIKIWGHDNTKVKSIIVDPNVSSYEIIFNNNAKIDINLLAKKVICQIGFNKKDIYMLLTYIRRSMHYNQFTKAEIDGSLKAIEYCILNNKNSAAIDIIEEKVVNQVNPSLKREVEYNNFKKIIHEWMERYPLNIKIGGGIVKANTITYEHENLVIKTSGLDIMTFDFMDGEIRYSGNKIANVDELNEWLYRLFRALDINTNAAISALDAFTDMINANQDKAQFDN